MFEQVANDGHAPEERHLVNRRILIGNHHTANHHRTAIIDENLRLGGLRIQSGSALDADALVDLGILYSDIQENRALPRDLRVTSSSRTASTYCVEIVLLMLVWIGIC